MKLMISLLLSLTLSQFALAEGESSGGDEFRKTAIEYQAEAKKYGDKGNYDIAALYQRMADIKLEAAEKGDAGKWGDIDWSEYHEIEAKIAKLKQQYKSEKKYSKK